MFIIIYNVDDMALITMLTISYFIFLFIFTLILSLSCSAL